jgi:hypothetical protein
MRNLKTLLVLNLVLFLTIQISGQDKESKYFLSNSVNKLEEAKTVKKVLNKIDEMSFLDLKRNLMAFGKKPNNKVIYLKNYKKFNFYLEENNLSSARNLIRELYLLNLYPIANSKENKENKYFLSNSVNKLEEAKTVKKVLNKIDKMSFLDLKRNLMAFGKEPNNKIIYLKNYKKFNMYLKNNDLLNARILIKNLYLIDA